MADAETVEFKGETVNSEFIEKLEKIIKEDWKVSKESASKSTTYPTDYKDSKGDAILIKADKKEEYELLKEFIEMLKFDLTNKSEIYRMPLGEMPESMKEFEINSTLGKSYKKQSIEFYITKKGANQLFQKHKDYEKLLGIEFPQELYQLVKPSVNIPTPNTKFPAPEPERYQEGAEAYETRMIEYYRSHGFEPELKETGRPPLPHEWVTYSDEIPKINPTTPIARPGYAQHLNELHLTPDISTDKAPKGLTEGERKRVKSTRPGHHLLTSIKFGKKELKINKILKAAAGIGLGAFGVSKFASILGTGKLPLIVLGQAAVKLLIPIVIILLGYLALKYGRKHIKQLKESLTKLIKGKKIDEEEPKHGGDSDSEDGDDSEGSEPDTEPDVDVDVELDAEGFFEEFQDAYKLYAELEGRKKILDTEITELMADKEKNQELIKEKMKEKDDIIAEQKRWCRRMYKTMAPYAQAAHIDPENPERGMGK